MFQLMKTFAGLAVAGVLLALGWMSAGQEREDIIAFYELTAEEADAYDSCKSALRGYELKKGGSEAEFCGCFAKKGTEKLAAGHKTLSARYIEAAATKKFDKLFEPLPDDATVAGSSGMDAALSIMDGFTTCAAEVTYQCPRDDAVCLEDVKARKAAREERWKEVRAARENGAAAPGSHPDETSAGIDASLASKVPVTGEETVADTPAVAQSSPAATSADFGHLLPSP